MINLQQNCSITNALPKHVSAKLLACRALSAEVTKIFFLLSTLLAELALGWSRLAQTIVGSVVSWITLRLWFLGFRTQMEKNQTLINSPCHVSLSDCIQLFFAETIRNLGTKCFF